MTRPEMLQSQLDTPVIEGGRAGARPVDAAPPQLHRVQFYDSEEFLHRALAAFASTAMAAGEPVVAFATPRSRAALIERLEATGIDVPAGTRSGLLTLLDADDVLERCMIDGLPDAGRLHAIVRDALRNVERLRPGRPVRAYGELVDLLCQRGQPEAALRLEEIWNDILRQDAMSLMCVYAMRGFREDGHAAQLAAVCHAHTHVVPTEAYSDDADDTTRLRAIVMLQQRARALETELAQRQTIEKALRAALDELERSGEALRAADRRKDEFLAMLAHELRNPLAPVLNGLQLLRRRGVDGSRHLDTVERQVRHLVRLVDDLLHVSRITRGMIELEVAPVEVGDILDTAIEMTRPMIRDRGHTLSVDVPERGLIVEADEVRLAQVFANVLGNAAKYTAPGGNVWITARRDGEQAVISIRDDGAGIELPVLQHVFDLFVQAKRGLDRSEGGLGVGLTVARTLVELHGGTITAESGGPGHGSEFVVRMPATVGGSARQRGGGAGAIALRDARLRILLVDDNEDAAEVMAEALRSHGHEVATAPDGAQALSLAPRFEPDVAVLDIGLPSMDGYEVARELRQLLPRPPRLIALSGYGQDADRAKSQAAGFEIHLVKPVDLDTLLGLFAA